MYSPLTENDINELSPCCRQGVGSSLCEHNSNSQHPQWESLVLCPFSIAGIWVCFRLFVIFLKNAFISFHSSWYKCTHFLRFKPRSGISGTQFLCMVKLIGRLPSPFQSVSINLCFLQQFIRNPVDPHYHQ